MNTATLERRVAALEREVRTLRRPALVAHASATANKPISVSNKKPKKLPRWLQDGLKDIEEGRVSGPFNTVDELMAHLQS